MKTGGLYRVHRHKIRGIMEVTLPESYMCVSGVAGGSHKRLTNNLEVSGPTAVATGGLLWVHGLIIDT